MSINFGGYLLCQLSVAYEYSLDYLFGSCTAIDVAGTKQTTKTFQLFLPYIWHMNKSKKNINAAKTKFCY